LFDFAHGGRSRQETKRPGVGKDGKICEGKGRVAFYGGGGGGGPREDVT